MCVTTERAGGQARQGQQWVAGHHTPPNMVSCTSRHSAHAGNVRPEPSDEETVKEVQNADVLQIDPHSRALAPPAEPRGESESPHMPRKC